MDETDLTTLTAEVVTNYVANNTLAVGEVGTLITQVHAALSQIGATPPPEPEYVPAVSIRASLADPGHIVSMIDGKRYLTLKRHLSRHGLTPDQYRARYKLPAGYPISAPAYSQRRREVAIAMGLGRKYRREPAKQER